MEDFEKKMENLKKRLEEVKKLKEEFEKLKRKGGIYVEPVELKFYSSEVIILEKKMEKLEKLMKDIVLVLENIIDLICGGQLISLTPKEESKEEKNKYSEILKKLTSR